MDSWHLTKLSATGTVALSHNETGWQLVDEEGRGARGYSLEQVILRATRPRSVRRPGLGHPSRDR